MFAEILSNRFNLTCFKKDNERVCQFPSENGSGYIKSCVFSNGMETIEINGLLTSRLNIKTIKSEGFFLRIIFNLRWAANYIDSNGEKHKLEQFDSIVSTQNKNQECSFDFDSKQPISLYIIEIDIESFKQKFAGVDLNDNTGITKLLNIFKEKKFFFSQDRCTLSMHNLLLKINKSEYTGKMRQVYQEAKASEILLARIKQVIDHLEGSEQFLQKQYNLANIEEVAIMISEQLDDLGTIKEIARNAGLTQQNLQSGFQQQFGCSVSQFVSDLRLNRAIELLDNSNLNMSEITYELGLNSRSYFSKIFKDRFGLGPQEYRNLYRINKQSS